MYVNGYLIERTQDGLHVRSYAEVDFRTTLPPGMMKKAIVLELKKVILKLIN